MSSRKYYKNIDLIRVLACIAVFLYHLNILKGGFLAVCVFFVLSGYLSCVSSFKREKFSIISYYKNRFLKIYIPLICVVFITISIVSLLSSINWYNLKPETTSILLGYNNFWQLGANLDYFASHSSSPFVHLWYIAILLQFDLIFPFLYLILRKIGDKVHKMIPCVLTFGLSLIGVYYFFGTSLDKNIMVTYYSTFTRVFSLLFGLSLGFIHSYYDSLVLHKIKNSKFKNLIFYLYILILVFLFIFIDAQSKYFAASMILSTIIGCRLIDYATVINKNKYNILDKIVQILSKISYDIYLVQYPIIFLFQYVNLTFGVKIVIIFILTILFSIILYSARNFNGKFKILKSVIILIISFLVSFGLLKYIGSKDYTLEMKQLEEQLLLNQETIIKNQENYELKLKEEQEAWNAILNDLETGESKLKDAVTNLSIVGIGDSVMLGAVENLYEQFPNSYIDAAVSRTAWVAGGILNDLKNKNMLGEVIVINLGANGDCSDACKQEIIEQVENRKVFWINVTNDQDVGVNEDLLRLAAQYKNMHVIDWKSISENHPEFFIVDGIHLTNNGRKAYTKAIYDAIYDVYLEDYRKKQNEIINKHDELLKNKIVFFGNNILLNSFDKLASDFSDAKFNIKADFNYETLKTEIIKGLENESLTNRIVLAFDKTANINIKQYLEIIELCKDRKVYILGMTRESLNINLPNVNVINFYNKLQNNSNYLMVDKIHLTEQGNISLIETLKQTLNN